MPTKVYTHSVFFCNPYKKPPDGKSRVLLEFVTEHHRPTKEQSQQIKQVIVENSGYSQGFTCEIINPRRWSLEAKQRVRKQRLEKRIAKKYSIPDLYEQALAEAIARKPEYYGT